MVKLSCEWTYGGDVLIIGIADQDLEYLTNLELNLVFTQSYEIRVILEIQGSFRI